PFALLVGFSTLYNRIDVVLITKFLGYTETGFYGAAYKFFNLLSFFPAVVSHSLYPMFVSLMAQQKIADIRVTLERYLRFMFAIALPLGVGGTLLSKPIILLLAGEQFAPAAPVLAVLVWATAILFIYIVVNALVISQLTKYAMGITAANVLINVIGNIILLPRIGIIGAAIMTVVSEFAQGVFYFYIVRKKITRFKFLPLIWRPLLSSGVMGFAVWQVRDQHLFVAVIIGAVVYTISLLLLRFFEKNDVVFVKTLLWKRNA
ncbi:MAG: polysaccharide biosynthesis C-terminal domain-containing protein, partial [bacterium]|nr:polysaccharide biosynthesis C-terminal domain-containing protein [bacterium]